MKTHMINHVETQRHGMFVRSTESVKTELQALCERVEQAMRAQVLDIYNLLARDYLAVLVGVEPGNARQAPGLPSPERLLRAEMLPVLRDAARCFIDASGGDENDPFEDESPVSTPSLCAGHDDKVDLDKIAAWAGDSFHAVDGDDKDPFEDESPGQGPNPCAGDDDDDDLDNLAATQLLHEESEAGARGRDSVGIKSEPAMR